MRKMILLISFGMSLNVSNDYRNIEIVHYKNEGKFLLKLYQDTGNVMLHVYNDN